MHCGDIISVHLRVSTPELLVHCSYVFGTVESTLKSSLKCDFGSYLCSIILKQSEIELFQFCRRKKLIHVCVCVCVCS